MFNLKNINASAVRSKKAANAIFKMLENTEEMHLLQLVEVFTSQLIKKNSYTRTIITLSSVSRYRYNCFFDRSFRSATGIFVSHIHTNTRSRFQIKCLYPQPGFSNSNNNYTAVILMKKNLITTQFHIL